MRVSASDATKALVPMSDREIHQEEKEHRTEGNPGVRRAPTENDRNSEGHYRQSKAEVEPGSRRTGRNRPWGNTIIRSQRTAQWSQIPPTRSSSSERPGCKALPHLGKAINRCQLAGAADPTLIQLEQPRLTVDTALMARAVALCFCLACFAIIVESDTAATPANKAGVALLTVHPSGPEAQRGIGLVRLGDGRVEQALGRGTLVHSGTQEGFSPSEQLKEASFGTAPVPS